MASDSGALLEFWPPMEVETGTNIGNSNCDDGYDNSIYVEFEDDKDDGRFELIFDGLL